MAVANFFGFGQRKLVLHAVLTHKTAHVDSFPAWIGGSGANLEVDNSDIALVEFEMEDGKVSLHGLDHEKVVLNGRPTQKGTLEPDSDYALLVGHHLVLLSWCKKPSEWLKTRAEDSWKIVSMSSPNQTGPFPFASLKSHAADALAVDSEAICHQAFCSTGFFLRDLCKALGWETSKPEPPPQALSFSFAAPRPVETAPEVNMDSGEFTCPACWLKFDRGDVLHVSSHSSLKGDPVLGEEEMLRFSATRFNDNGQALDGMGIPATEMACPHCRRKLPPSFLDLEQHIISIVGAPSSGKSYYLSVLVKTLQNSLFTHFQTAFYDGDPKENVRLTEMKNKLFSASTPAEAMLAKTDLEGDMYLTVPRMGRKVLMPKPFVFNVAPQDREHETMSLVLYDNAGEHFQPDADSVSSPAGRLVGKPKWLKKT